MSQSQDRDGSVAGYCPMGCGETLLLGAGGRVTCRVIGCPEPSAVDQLLDDRETEHIVEFRDAAFTVRHPLRERLGEKLLDCALHEHVAGLAGPPVQLGRYRATFDADSWTWDLLPEATS